MGADQRNWFDHPNLLIPIVSLRVSPKDHQHRKVLVVFRFGLCIISVMSKYIEALLIERKGYEQRGLKDRVKAVDAALAELGYEGKNSLPEVEVAAIEPDAERAVRKAVSKRRA